MNKSLESTPGSGSDASVLIEQNRKRSNSCDENFVIEKLVKMV